MFAVVCSLRGQYNTQLFSLSSPLINNLPPFARGARAALPHVGSMVRLRQQQKRGGARAERERRRERSGAEATAKPEPPRAPGRQRSPGRRRRGKRRKTASPFIFNSAPDRAPPPTAPRRRQRRTETQHHGGGRAPAPTTRAQKEKQTPRRLMLSGLELPRTPGVGARAKRGKRHQGYRLQRTQHVNSKGEAVLCCSPYSSKPKEYFKASYITVYLDTFF